MSLRKLVKTRGVVRSSVTRTIGTITTLLANENVDWKDVQFNVALLKDAKAKLDKLNEQIVEFFGDDESIEDELEASIEYDKSIIKVFSDVKYIKESDDIVRNAAEGDIARMSVASSNSAQNSQMNFKLPRLEIKKFSGDIKQWNTFWTQFKTAIDENCSLANVDKFVYLRSLLVGSALTAIDGIVVSNENYNSAVELLKERFGDNEMIINEHMQILMNLKAVRSMRDVKGIRKLYDDCEVQIRCLENLNVPSETFGALLKPLLLNLIPAELGIEIQRRSATSKLSVKDILQLLKLEVESREKQMQMSSNGINYNDNYSKSKEYEKQKMQRNGNQMWNEKPFSAAALATSHNLKCYVCEGNHTIFNCDKSVEEKRRLIKEKGKCFNCLGSKHMAKDCKSKRKCNKCNKRHHSVLCADDGFAFRSEQKNTEPKQCAENEADEVVSTASDSCAVLLQTASVVLKGNSGSVICRLMLDSGSQKSFIKKDVAKKIGANVIGNETVEMFVFGAANAVETTREKFTVFIQGTERKGNIKLELSASDTITNAEVGYPSAKIMNMLLKNKLIFADNYKCVKDSSIAVLIGNDYLAKILTGQTVRISSRLLAVETIFGWCLMGCLSSCVNINNINVSHCAEKELDSVLRRFWELESIGIRDEVGAEISENVVVKQFEENVKFNGQRYSVALPFNSKETSLSDNLVVAKCRFDSLCKKFRRNPELFERYKTVIEEQLERGVAENVTTTINDGNVLYYMPHQAVIREDKDTTKLRVVFDASAKVGNKASLNECLHVGPNLVPDLVKVLLNFRMYKYCFAADIKKAFLQIEVREEDRDALRFLWIRGELNRNGKQDYDIYRMTRVIFGAACSPFLLSMTIKHHISKYRERYPSTVQRLEENLYVDDFIGSCAEKSELLNVIKESNIILKEGGFELTKWKSSDNSNSVECQDAEKENNVKILGVIWRTAGDVLSFNGTSIVEFASKSESTKRTVLMTTARLFDPLGLISPFTVRAKMLFQRLWELGIKWDDILPQEISAQWKQWCDELLFIEQISAQRNLISDSEQKMELHIFSDASEKAYGAVAYLRTIFEHSIESKLVMSKSRVAPLKKLTIPRLELMGCVLSVRIGVYLKELFDELNVFHWTDSSVCYHWIRGDAKKWKPFVSNRVSEIQEKSNPQQWFHVEGKQNPADKISRGCSMQELIADKLWWNGPEFLVNETIIHDTNVNVNEEDDTVKEEKRKTYTANFQCDVKKEFVFDERKYSSCSKTIRITAYMKRFIFNCRSKMKRNNELSVDEIQEAKLYWIRSAQEIFFAEEYKLLSRNQSISKKSLLIELNPYIEDGVMRVKGIQFSDECTENEKHPIILPSKAAFTELLIKEAHEKVMHTGLEATLSLLRENYWIIRGRQTVKKEIRKCFVCRKYSVQKGNQIFAPLPKDRLKETYAFQVTGIDFAGPLLNKYGEKRYIALFTCAVTRAVHLELVIGMDIECFVLCLKRFISRRGIPEVIYSDNFKTFKRADLEMKVLFSNQSEEKVKSIAAQEGIKWKYSVERAPWWGGFWERLVRSVKIALKKNMGKALLRDDELVTILCEIEAVINSRPLTYVGSELGSEPLSPALLLIGRSLKAVPNVRCDKNDSVNDQTITKRWKYRQQSINHFWNRWRKEYLLQLRSAFETKGKEKNCFKVGDVVLLQEDNVRRQMWPLCIIEEIFIGRDGKVRSVMLKTNTGTRIKRPIQRIYQMEVATQEQENETVNVSLAGVCCNSEQNESDEKSGAEKLPAQRCEDMKLLLISPEQKTLAEDDLAMHEHVGGNCGKMCYKSDDK